MYSKIKAIVGSSHSPRLFYSITYFFQVALKLQELNVPIQLDYRIDLASLDPSLSTPDSYWNTIFVAHWKTWKMFLTCLVWTLFRTDSHVIQSKTSLADFHPASSITLYVGDSEHLESISLGRLNYFMIWVLCHFSQL